MKRLQPQFVDDGLRVDGEAGIRVIPAKSTASFIN